MFLTVDQILKIRPCGSSFMVHMLHQKKIFLMLTVQLLWNFQIIPKNFILIPGVGAQGGSLKEISTHSMNNNCGIIVNVSRDIIYADSSTSFESKIREKTLIYKNQMEQILNEKRLI